MTAMPKSSAHLFLLYSCWYLALVIASANLYGHQVGFAPLSQETTDPTCVGSRMHKLLLNQTGYVQYVHYMTERPIPELNSFHTCFWMMLLNPRRQATALNYALDWEANSNNISVYWTGGNRPKWNIEVNGILVAAARTTPVTAYRWHHVCMSWNGRTGEWSTFQDGKLTDTGTSFRGRGLRIPAGGDMVSGQQQNTLNDGMDRGLGFEGWLTLFHLDSNPLPFPRSEATSSLVRRWARSCEARDRGNLIGWLRTPRKGYGGIMETPAKEDCQNF